MSKFAGDDNVKGNKSSRGVDVKSKGGRRKLPLTKHSVSVKGRMAFILALLAVAAVLNAAWFAANGTSVFAAQITWDTPSQKVAGSVYPVVKVRDSDGDVGLAVSLSAGGVAFADSVHNYSLTTFPTSAGANHTYGTFDHSGNFDMVWQDRVSSGDYHTYFVKISPTLDHGQPQDLTAAIGANIGKFPSIAITTDGKLFLANEEDNGQVGVFESDDNGNTWGNNNILGVVGALGRSYTRIAVDTANRPHMIFCTTTDVFAVDRNSNGTWSSAVQIDNLGTPGNRAFWSDIAASPNGDLFGVWQEDGLNGVGVSREISAVHWDHNSGKWQPEVQNISQSSSYDAYSPGLAVDSNNNVWVGFRATDNAATFNGAKYVVSFDNGHTYSQPVDVFPPQYSRSEMVNMTFGGGYVYLVQQLADSSSIFGAWLTRTSISGTPPTTTTTPAPTTTTSPPTPTPTPVSCPPLSSKVTALPGYEPSAFVVNWTGSGGLNTLAYTVQYWDMTASTQANWQTLVSNVVGPAAILTNAVNGHLYAFRSQATDGCSIEAVHANPDTMTVIDSTPPAAQPGVSNYVQGSMTLRLDLANNATDNGGSGIASVQLSNNSSFSNYYELPFTNTLTGVSWNLDAAQYGGNPNPGQKTVYIRYKDNVGNVPATPPYSFTENVTLNASNLTNLQYQPEGDTSNGNNEFLNFFNPSPNDASVLITYVNADGTTVQAGYGVTSLGHLSINTALDVQSVHSISIASDQVLYGDLANYKSTGGMDALQNATAVSTNWYFPDGSVANGRNTSFDLYNPGTNPAAVNVTYYGQGGNILGTSAVNNVPAGQRVSITDVPSTQAAFSTKVTVTNGVGIVAGRRMTWPGGGYSLSLGMPNSSANWYFGYNDNHQGSGDYIRVFNPTTSAATLNFTTLALDGAGMRSNTFQLAANTGATYSFSQLAGGAVGVINRHSLGAAMVALKASDASGAGLNVLAEEVQMAHGSRDTMVLPGSPALATHWIIPGEINSDPTFPVNQTDSVVMANFNTVTAYATLTAVDDSGNSVCSNCQPIAIAPHTAVIVNLNKLGGTQNKKLVVLVDTPNPNFSSSFFKPKTVGPQTLTIAGIVIEHIQQYSNEGALVLGQFDPNSTVAAK